MKIHYIYQEYVGFYIVGRRVFEDDGSTREEMYNEETDEWEDSIYVLGMFCGEEWAYGASEKTALRMIGENLKKMKAKGHKTMEGNKALKGKEMTEVLKKAIAYATKKHEGVYRKGTNTPYITHPMEAMAIVSTMTDDEEVLAAAVLHDTVEDTDATAEEITRLFGERVGRLVAAETENKREELPPGATWEIRKQETIEDVRNAADLDVKRVALGDKLSNMRAMERDYRELGDDLWKRFHQKDKGMQGWYYRSLRDAMEELKDTAAWKEYDALVKEVFG